MVQYTIRRQVLAIVVFNKAIYSVIVYSRNTLHLSKGSRSLNQNFKGFCSHNPRCLCFSTCYHRYSPISLLSARILIDPTFTRSFVSTSLVAMLGLFDEPLEFDLCITTPLGKSLLLKQVLKGLPYCDWE